MRRIRKAGTQERFLRQLLFSCFPVFLIPISSIGASEPIIIGSKKFTESYVLAEIAKRAIENTGVPTEHRQGMGGTIILWQALRGDQIALYPEYTGTISEEILKTPPSITPGEMREELAKFGVGMTSELRV